MRSKTDVARFLRKCVQFLEEISESDFARLVEGSLKLALVDSEGKERMLHSRDLQFEELANQLRGATSRADATRLLREDPSLASKDDLAKLARAFHVRVGKQDKRETIEDKIAEAAIGVRLRSEAIQGVNLKGGSPVVVSSSREALPASEEEERR